MGAGPAELLLDGNRGGGQIISDSGKRLRAGFEPEPKTERRHAAGGPQPRHQARAGRQKNARLVSITLGKEMTNDQYPMTSEAPIPNDQMGTCRRSLVLGTWSFTGHWPLVIGHS